MNQDQNFNQDDRRDGERRSFGKNTDGRRDDNRQNKGFERGNARGEGDKRPRFDRNARRDDARRDDARPGGFNRGERNGNDRFGDDRPRFDRRDDARRGDARRPFNRDNDSRDGGRFGRSDGPRNDNRRFDGPREGGFNRNDDRRSGGFNRESGSDRPRFDRNDRRSDGPRFDGPREGGFNRDDKGFGNRGERPSFDRAPRRNDGPREGGFNRRNDGDERGPSRFGNERRFNDTRGGDRRESGFDRNNERGEGRSFNRRNDDNRGDGRRGESRFNRHGDRPEGGRRDFNNRGEGNRRPFGDQPSGDRRGPFNRRDDDAQDKSKRFGRDNEFDKRFTDEQRDDSRERRVGRYKAAPDYKLDKPGLGKPGFSKPGFDKKSDKKSFGKRDDKPRPEREHDERDPSGLMRLNRYIANAGVCSRREADELISRGDITVNGKVVTEMGYKVKENDVVKYGKTVLNPEKMVYVLLNKPKDYITTTEDPEERRTVMELVADVGNFRIYPVGRLDRNTTGLLLLTNDGELADKLTHPSNNIRKIYQAELDKPITEEHFEAIRAGVELEDGMIKPDDLALVTPDAQVVGIEIHSGRNRIVRRIFEHFGYEVMKLDRTVYATLTKKELPRGKWRFLEPKEVIKLKYLN
ncbi:pseudouridine synthase [Rudanella lutea]|uniref:pseudouridine synthase n=1 Tax=Rudanella lutea TaxID=451374 RepID=UPI00036EF479|nr:pseudouridine synthase [Rudanella lutea]